LTPTNVYELDALNTVVQVVAGIPTVTKEAIAAFRAQVHVICGEGSVPAFSLTWS
jgi:hypothetical protein